MSVLRLCQRSAILLVAMLALSACSPVQPISITPVETAVTPLPAAVEYDLGEATIVQERFPEDSRFRNMPVRLNGVIAAPADGGPFPVVLILHGTHPGCPEVEHGVDRWPCDPAVEQPNYRGFAYLVSDLAAQGYVALSININAENTFGFGEAMPGERLPQTRRPPSRRAGRGRGRRRQCVRPRPGRSRRSQSAWPSSAIRAGPMPRLHWRATWPPNDGSGERAYGPVSAALLIAPPSAFTDPAGGVPSPTARSWRHATAT